MFANFNLICYNITVGKRAGVKNARHEKAPFYQEKA